MCRLMSRYMCIVRVMRMFRFMLLGVCMLRFRQVYDKVYVRVYVYVYM